MTDMPEMGREGRENPKKCTAAGCTVTHNGQKSTYIPAACGGTWHTLAMLSLHGPRSDSEPDITAGDILWSDCRYSDTVM